LAVLLSEPINHALSQCSSYVNSQLFPGHLTTDFDLPGLPDLFLDRTGLSLSLSLPEMPAKELKVINTVSESPATTSKDLNLSSPTASSSWSTDTPYTFRVGSMSIVHTKKWRAKSCLFPRRLGKTSRSHMSRMGTHVTGPGGEDRARWDRCGREIRVGFMV